MRAKLLRDMETSNHKFKRGEVCTVVENPLEHSTTDLIKVLVNGKKLICVREDVEILNKGE